MQAYSLQLFRQGNLHVLRGDSTTKDAETEWAKVEAKRQNRYALQDQWPHAKLLPCRSCTLENHGAEVRKPLKAFTSTTKNADPWIVLAKGQDQGCIKCVQAFKNIIGNTKMKAVTFKKTFPRPYEYHDMR